MRPGFTFILILFFSMRAMQAQYSYDLSLKKDGLIFLGSVVLLTGEHYLEQKLQPLTFNQVEKLEIDRINGFDRFAVQNYSESALKRSGIGFYTSMALGAGMLMSASVKSDEAIYSELPKLAVIFLETNVINYGIANVVKNLGIRTRPYVYNRELDFESSGKHSTDARKSFYSGRTATTAANSFFMAKVYSDYFPESRWKPAFWTLAALLPAWTGVERVISGQHFPSDVVVGYAVGAFCGYFIPHLHRSTKEEELLQIIPGVGEGHAVLTLLISF